MTCWPLSLDLWLAYVGFAEGSAARSVTPEQLVQLYSRAVRNVGWSGTLWCGYLRSVQQAGSQEDEIQAAVQASHARVHMAFLNLLPLVAVCPYQTDKRFLG